MSVNKDLPHVLILPEDDANRQVATGFHLAIDWNRQRRMQVLTEVGGWKKVLGEFKSVHVREMDRCPSRSMILLIDLDGREDRLTEIRTEIPEHLAARVYILGALREPEDLRAALGPFEAIGKGLANDCREETEKFWSHDDLLHNAAELDRLREHIRPILFS